MAGKSAAAAGDEAHQSDQFWPTALEGENVKVEKETCTNMLMTKPLSAIGGQGTLDKSFPGNVFLDTGTLGKPTLAPTGMILFTGEGGINTHTWLKIGDTRFDPVLGTKATR